MQSFIFFAKTLLFFFISLNAVAQVTLPVPKPAAVFGSYLAGYGCRYTFTGSCNFAITPSSPLVAQEKNETGRLIDSINSQYGAAHVGGQFNDLNYLPKLGAYAYAYAYGIPPQINNPDPSKYTGQTGTMMDANIWSVARYRYNGSSPNQLSLRAALDTEIHLPEDNPLLGHSLMRIGVFTSNDYNYSIDGICPIGGFTGCSTNSTNLGNLSVSLSSTDRWILEILYDVLPGQEFYVGAMLDANVCCNGVVNSSRTMTMQFSDTTNLELLSVAGAPINAVDEPPTVLLAAIGLILLISIRKKSSKASPGRPPGQLAASCGTVRRMWAYALLAAKPAQEVGTA